MTFDQQPKKQDGIAKIDAPTKIIFCRADEVKKKKIVTKWIPEWCDEISALVFRDTIYVISAICPHFGGSFSYEPGEGVLRCKWHEWRFDVVSGNLLNYELKTCLSHYPFEETPEGELEVSYREIFEQTYSREVDCAASVAVWNYWDHEHLTVVHESFTDANVLFEDENVVCILTTFKLPIFWFLTSNEISTFIKHSASHFSAIELLRFGIPFHSTIKIFEISENRCRITMNYKYYLRGWRIFLFKPVLKLMASRWNEKIWLEDLEMKLRRQKVLRWGFKDFVGMPENLTDRVNDGPLEQRIPVPRPKGSPIDKLRELSS